MTLLDELGAPALLRQPECQTEWELTPTGGLLRAKNSPSPVVPSGAAGGE